MERSLPSLFKNVNIAYFGSLAAGFALIWMLDGFIDPNLLYGWFIANVLVILLRIQLSYINPYPDDHLKNKKYRRVILLVGIAISGVVWASSAWLLFSPDNIVRQMLLIFVLLGMISASPAVAGSNMIAFIGFTQPIVLALFLRLIYQGEEIYYIMASLLFFGNVVLIMTSIHFAIIQTNSIRARKEAEMASYAKSNFLANISHEVRTPMNAIVGINHLLKQTQLTRQQHDYVDRSFVASNSLLESIDSILDYSKIEKHEGRAQLSWFNLRDVLHRVITLVELDAQDKGLLLRSLITKDTACYLIGDHVKLVQILSNLVKNAVKFTDQGEVELVINQIEKSKMQSKSNAKTITKALLHFSVRDTGIGIDQSDYNKLFKPFSQVNASYSRGYAGTGLGLSISQQLASVLGSVIEMESIPDKGSTFYFSLWFDKGSAKGGVEGTKTGINNGVQIRQQGLPTLPSLAGYEILIVEDDELNQLVVQEFLSYMGAKAIVVGSAQLAFDYLNKQLPDLILLDIQMPKVDGFETIDIIRSTEEWKGIPVICLTAHTSATEKEKALSLGMNDFLNKPIDPVELQVKLLKWLPQESKRRSCQQGSFNSLEPINSPEQSNKSTQSISKINLMSDGKSKKEISRNISMVMSMLESGESRSQFIKTAIVTLESSNNTLQDDLSRHNWKSASMCAHRLRGSANLYSSSILQQCLQDINNGLVNEQNLKEKLDLLNAEFALVLDQLKCSLN